MWETRVVNGRGCQEGRFKQLSPSKRLDVEKKHTRSFPLFPLSAFCCFFIIMYLFSLFYCPFFSASVSLLPVLGKHNPIPASHPSIPGEVRSRIYLFIKKYFFIFNLFLMFFYCFNVMILGISFIKLKKYYFNIFYFLKIIAIGETLPYLLDLIIAFIDVLYPFIKGGQCRSHICIVTLLRSIFLPVISPCNKASREMTG